MSQDRLVKIAPSILAADFQRLGEHVREAEQGGANAIHVDVMDGHFVPNITIGPLVVRALRPITRLPLQVHLMIEQPERYIDEFAAAGADMIIVHVETCPHLNRTLDQIRMAGAQPGVTLNPATPLVMVEEVLDLVDLVLLMTVNPGFGGQKMIPSSCARVKRLRSMLDAQDLDCSIEVDGGVNRDTLADVVRAGADYLVMGSAIFAAEEGVGPALAGVRSMLAEL